MPVDPRVMRMVAERSGRDMPSQATAPRAAPSVPVRPPMPAQAMGGAMPPQGLPPQAAAQAMPPRRSMMKSGGSVKASKKSTSKAKGVGIAKRGYGCGGKVKMK